MARKTTKSAIALTPAEAAAEKAARVVALRAEIAAKGEEAAALLEELADYCDENGLASGAEIGPLQAVRRSSPAKIEFPGTPKEKAAAAELLMADLPAFVVTKQSLDVAKLFVAMNHDRAVANALAARAATISQATDWIFKGL